MQLAFRAVGVNKAVVCFAVVTFYVDFAAACATSHTLFPEPVLPRGVRIGIEVADSPSGSAEGVR